MRAAKGVPVQVEISSLIVVDQLADLLRLGLLILGRGLEFVRVLGILEFIRVGRFDQVELKVLVFQI